jgi:hypothetical protein
MSVTIWQGTVTSPAAGGSQVSFTLDPPTGAIAQAASSGPIAFHPAPGYADLSGAFTSQVTFTPGALPADVPAAWAAAAGSLVILDSSKTYTMTITEM